MVLAVRDGCCLSQALLSKIRYTVFIPPSKLLSIDLST